ncbi:aldehyde dehydrogenase family protein [Mesorhizobium sp. M7A.F.Ca.US.006.01.1.1]|uniref:aldehyde dehydrogenase family protein n=1 Tax=Mesorhizobium sp. M7A.F.Ca.US.006.01.1.1 TaxID=2496707 RepID=UPI001FE1552C|nr:aldehyde dehydrogenase family protein [Mesorhizobium sp. M7A.F.Ca.US.006.01.1.1]
MEAARKLTVGDPLDPSIAMGPMARSDLGTNSIARSSKRSNKARLAVGRPQDRRCRQFLRGDRACRRDAGDAVFEQETFGPVAAITVADNVEHATELDNTSDYGLGDVGVPQSPIANLEVRSSRVSRRLH